MDVYRRGVDIATNPKHTRWIWPLLVLVDAVLTGVIIEKIPYTEIDWTTYMQHISLYNKGERDYHKITGSTGPLVYPGAHVFIYRFLYWVTDEGRDIHRAQYIFAGVYLVTLGVVMGTYRAAKVPPYIFPLLILSKRLHSIFVLRLFNDCFAVLGLFAAILAYQKGQWHLGSFFYTTGLNVKMSLLLPLPAIGILALQALGSREAVTQAMIIAQVSIGYGFPFRMQAPSYFSRAFELTRQFLYQWTVNWRFIPEPIFLSRPFALTLLATHVSLLLFFATTRWIKPSQRKSLRDFLNLIRDEPRNQHILAQRITPDFILTTLLSATAIGLLCARSLHYQFYAYVAWSTPFLLWKAGWHPVAVYAIWGVQEWAWNVYPSTPVSSGVVVGTLAVTVLGAWWGTRGEFESVEANGVVEGHEHAE